jgi:hypothetical protein
VDRRTRLLRTLVTVGALALAALPAAVVFGLGWLTFGHPDLPGGASTPPDTTPPEAWALFALFYLVWLFGLMVLVIWSFDRIGHHWHAWDRPPRREKKRRRRLTAGVDFLAGQEKAHADAEAELARRRARLEENRKRASAGGAAPPGDAGRAKASGRPEDR